MTEQKSVDNSLMFGRGSRMNQKAYELVLAM